VWHNWKQGEQWLLVARLLLLLLLLVRLLLLPLLMLTLMRQILSYLLRKSPLQQLPPLRQVGSLMSDTQSMSKCRKCYRRGQCVKR